MEEMKTIEIHDKVFEETYTAHIQRNGRIGWGGFRTFQKSSVRIYRKNIAENS